MNFFKPTLFYCFVVETFNLILVTLFNEKCKFWLTFSVQYGYKNGDKSFEEQVTRCQVNATEFVN